MFDNRLSNFCCRSLSIALPFGLPLPNRGDHLGQTAVLDGRGSDRRTPTRHRTAPKKLDSDRTCTRVPVHVPLVLLVLLVQVDHIEQTAHKERTAQSTAPLLLCRSRSFQIRFGNTARCEQEKERPALSRSADSIDLKQEPSCLFCLTKIARLKSIHRTGKRFICRSTGHTCTYSSRFFVLLNTFFVFIAFSIDRSNSVKCFATSK